MSLPLTTLLLLSSLMTSVPLISQVSGPPNGDGVRKWSWSSKFKSWLRIVTFNETSCFRILSLIQNINRVGTEDFASYSEAWLELQELLSQ